MAAYPQPADAAALPAWRQPAPDAPQPLDVSACAHVIAIHAIPALHDARRACTADATALLEELMPLLAPRGAAAQHAAATAARVGAYLAGLSRVLELHLRDDAGDPSGDRGADDDGSDAMEAAAGLLDAAPVLGIAAVNILQFIARCGPVSQQRTVVPCPGLAVPTLARTAAAAHAPAATLAHRVQVPRVPPTRLRRRSHAAGARAASRPPQLQPLPRRARAWLARCCGSPPASARASLR
jgi:hypothetical protein